MDKAQQRAGLVQSQVSTNISRIKLFILQDQMGKEGDHGLSKSVHHSKSYKLQKYSYKNEPKVSIGKSTFTFIQWSTAHHLVGAPCGIFCGLVGFGCCLGLVFCLAGRAVCRVSSLVAIVYYLAYTLVEGEGIQAMQVIAPNLCFRTGFRPPGEQPCRGRPAVVRVGLGSLADMPWTAYPN